MTNLVRGPDGSNDFYSRRTNKDYFNNNKDFEERIYTGLSLYEDTKKLLLGKREGRKKIREFEEFLSFNFFNGRSVNIIPNVEDDVIHVSIGNDPELPIFKLGDGIQSIIILTYPLFFNMGEKLQIFIEEPEHYLHPGFQRVFMETLMQERLNTFQYFITTHSNHLLDITLDLEKISVYTFKKEINSDNISTFKIENVENENAHVLELIGVRNSSVFLSNCTIWVEGITDRIYIRRYLDVLQATKEVKYKEDTHFSFVEYGGNNITHWSFLKDTDHNFKNIEVERLCGKLFLITDKDGARESNERKTKKSQRHIELSKKLGDRYYCLTCREIENTLTPNVLKEVVKAYEKKPDLVIEDFSQKDYKDEQLGIFLNEIVKERKRSYEKAGTISDKLNFAKKAVQFISSTADLSKEALALAEKLYSFIESKNK